MVHHGTQNIDLVFSHFLGLTGSLRPGNDFGLGSGELMIFILLRWSILEGHGLGLHLEYASARAVALSHFALGRDRCLL